ncbi:hypothetical protein Asi02nite_72240 [Asanoa siamensis]|uniref:WD40 repeat protein n=1 Tax=Asanoa siamensis TaxID=926357 RepID=A0ABQ4D2H4_9ACTN|nr:hypothetical protein Asi02nite_72240 [Asanoa siamensis]
MAWLVMALGGCAAPRAEVVVRTSPVWLADDAIYFLRQAGSGQVEIWSRGSTDGDRERFVASRESLPEACGVPAELFRMGDGRLGVALDCDSTRLLAFDPVARTFARIADLRSRVAEVTLSADLSNGYSSGVNERCWWLSTIGLPDGRLAPALPDLTCAAGGSARSPVLTRWGGLVFVATRDEAAGAETDRDNRRWSVHLGGFQGVPYKGIGPTFQGPPDLDLSPDEETAAVTVTKFDRWRLLLVDLRDGETRELHSSPDRLFDPSFAPDGREVAFSDGHQVKIVRLGR